MPKYAILLALLLALSGVTGQSQGTILFQNSGPGLYAPVTDPQGNLVQPNPDYIVELCAGPSLAALVPVARTTLTSPGFFGEGQAAIVIPGIAPGEHPAFQVRMWDSLGGTVTSWDHLRDAPASVSGAFHLSFSGPGLGDPGAVPPIEAPPLYGMQGFTFPSVIPEPTAIWLLLSVSPWLWSGVVRRVAAGRHSDLAGVKPV